LPGPGPAGPRRTTQRREPEILRPGLRNARKHLRLALVGTLVDEEAGAALGLSRPEIAFPSSHPDEAQTVEIDIAVMVSFPKISSGVGFASMTTGLE
jgi:hypothetical protein